MSLTANQKLSQSETRTRILCARLVMELNYPWNKQSAYVSGYYSKKCDWCLQYFLAGESFLTDSTSIATILLQWCSWWVHGGYYQRQAPCGQSVYTRGHDTAAHPSNIFLQHLHLCIVVILSLLHVPRHISVSYHLSVYYIRFCCRNMSLQHSCSCLATLRTRGVMWYNLWIILAMLSLV